MSDPLATNQLDRLLPVLRHIAELISRRGALNRDQLQVLLITSGIEEEWALNELERWSTALGLARNTDDADTHELVQRSLELRGVPEASAQLAVSIAIRSRSAPPVAAQPLTVSVERIDLGMLLPHQPASAEFDVTGGPGRVETDNDQLSVNPAQFGPQATRIHIEVRPLQAGVLWTSLRLVAAGETRELPLVAQWSTPAPAPENAAIAANPTTQAPARHGVTHSGSVQLPAHLSSAVQGQAAPSSVAPPPSAGATTSATPQPAFSRAALATSLRGSFSLTRISVTPSQLELQRNIPGLVLLDDQRALVISGTGAALIDLHTGGQLWVLSCPTAAGALSEDGKLLALGGIGEIFIWNMPQQALVARMSVPDQWVRSVAFDPERKVLASGGADKIIRLWDAETGRELRHMTNEGGQIFSLAFSPDGETLAIGSADSKVRLWRLEKDADVLSLAGHQRTVSAVAFSPDGRYVGSASYDWTVRIWAAQTGQETQCLKGHKDGITSVTYDQEGVLLASGGGDGVARLWDIASGRQVGWCGPHNQRITALGLSSDGRYLAVGLANKAVSLWEARSGQFITQTAIV